MDNSFNTSRVAVQFCVSRVFNLSEPVHRCRTEGGCIMNVRRLARGFTLLELLVVMLSLPWLAARADGRVPPRVSITR
jgi:hypothetical protein